MFIDSKPTSLYSRTLDSEMETPMPQLHRLPPILHHSSPSLIGFEKSISGLQSFAKRPTPPNHEKPLPLVPDQRGRPNQPDRQTRFYLSDFPRRTSSVYSRTASQYVPTPEPWENEEPTSSNHFLQPSIYSLSTPELNLDQPSEELMPTPRLCAPLFASPSPSPSLRTSPSPSAEFRRQILRPSTPIQFNIMTQYIKTVSLDNVKAALRSPGVQPLLPEEMRALVADKKARERILRTSHSFEGIIVNGTRFQSTHSMGPGFPSSNDKKWPLQANQQSNKRDSKVSDDYFGITKQIRNALLPVEMQLGSPLDTPIPRTSETTSYDCEPRGRARVRSYDLLSRRSADTGELEQEVLLNKNLMTEAQHLADEYHSLSREQSKNSIKSPIQSVEGSAKLVPQPLFFNSRQVSKQRAREYQREVDQQRYSPGPKSQSSQVTLQEKRSSPARKERPNLFPYKLSLTPELTGSYRRRSTSGSIPISPPFASTSPITSLKSAVSIESPVRKRSIDDSNRFSVFYQRINADAEQLAREYASSNRVPCGVNILPKIFASQEVESTGDQFVPPSSHPHFRKTSSNEGSVISVASSKAFKTPIKSSMHKSLTAVSSVFSNHVRKSSVSTGEDFYVSRKRSKQRRPSFPVISAPLPITNLEASPVLSTAAMAKRPSLFHIIRDHKRDSKASKRREQLKKTIKVIPRTTIPKTKSVTTPTGNMF